MSEPSTDGTPDENRVFEKIEDKLISLKTLSLQCENELKSYMDELLPYAPTPRTDQLNIDTDTIENSPLTSKYINNIDLAFSGLFGIQNQIRRIERALPAARSFISRPEGAD